LSAAGSPFSRYEDPLPFNVRQVPSRAERSARSALMQVVVIERNRGQSRLSDIPSALNPPAGCRFHTRCPFVMPICRTQEPLLRTTAAGHQVACHLTEST